MNNNKSKNNILNVRPDLAKEWHPTLNGDLTPENTALKSNKKIWWLCPSGHSWQCTPDKRISRGTNCHYCSNKKVLIGYNDLPTTHPKLCEEWDYEKNVDILPKQYTQISRKKVWWKCKKCNNSWETKIYDRAVENRGCPKCAVAIRSNKRHLTELKNNGPITDETLLKDFDYEANYPLTPNDFTPQANKYVFWKCHTCGYKWKAKVSNRANGRGCPCCGNKVVIKGINDLATTHPELAKEMNIEASGFSPDEITAGSGKKAIWKCPKGHTYKATILHRSYGTNCPECFKGRQTSFAEKAVYYYVKQLYPDAISQYKDKWLGRMELDIYIPSINYAIEYDGIAWHKKNRLQNDQLKYQRCLAHNIKLIRLREESPDKLVGLDIADRVYGCKDLHEYKNLEPVINQILTFLNFRDLGHPIDVNIKRDRFKIDSYKNDLKDYNLETSHPNIAKEWHPTLNGDLKPSMYKPHSDIKFWWLCPDCGNSYEATIGHRVDGTGCPKCGIKKSALSKSKKVKMIDLNTNEIIKVFDSISDASREMKISSGNISAVCRGERKQASGYKWEYYE